MSMLNYADGDKAPGPLDGIRVIDLGRYQAGPRCGLVFARLGADVIKVEPPGRGDESRGNGPFVRGQSAYWVQYNSGKRSLSLNLRTAKGKEILRDLIEVSDVLIQNFRPGTIDKMGFGYEVISEINPGIVMVNISAYGQYGPLSDRIGFDQIGQALSGLMSLNGDPNGGPMMVPFPLVDRITALHGAISALSALYERSISGKGQAIDVCLADSGYTTNEIPISAYLGDGQIPERTGNRVHLADMYKTRDGYVYLANFASDNIFGRVADVIGHPGWKNDARFASRDARTANVQIVEKELVEWFLTRSSEDSLQILGDAGVPASVVNDTRNAANEPHMQDREVMLDVPDPVSGNIHVSGRVFKFSRSGSPVGTAPTVGEHTDEILSELLQMGDEKINEIRRAGIV